MPGQRASLAILIIVEAAAFGYMSQTVLFPMIVALAAFVGWRGQWRFSMSQERRVVVGLLVALLFVVMWRIRPYSLFDDAMDYLSPFLHSVGQYLLVLQTAALYLEFDDDILPVTLPWPGVFVMISAGDVTLGGHSPQRVAFQFFALAFTGAAALFFAASTRSSGQDIRPVRATGKTGVTVALLLVTFCMAGLAATALYSYENALNRLVSELLTPTMNSSSAGFPSRAQIGSVARRKSERSQDVALRVYAEGRPGYFRGKAYHWLASVNNGRFGETTQWEEAPPRYSTPPFGDPADSRLKPVATDGIQFRFDLRDPPGGPFDVARTMEVWLEPPQWGVYFLPPRSIELLTNEDTIRRDYRQVTSGTDVGVASYTVRSGEQTATPPLTDVSPDGLVLSRETLTFAPPMSATDGTDEQVQAIADSIFQNCETVDEHIVAVEQFFQTNYGYAIGIDPPPGQDPLRWFLLTKPNAHCEYFAQGAAYLLRLADIPTRYMTGFVVAERNEYGDFWVARNAHAHAWCEVWDEHRGWVIVEATPSAGVPGSEATPWHKQMWEYLSGELARFRHQFREEGWPWLLRQVLAFLATPPGWIVLALIVAYIFIRWRMQRTGPSGPSLTPAVRDLNALLSRMDRRLARTGLTRKPGETLLQFADRIDAETGGQASADWYRRYAAIRYRSPDASAVADLRNQFRSLQRSLVRDRSRTPA